MLDATPAGWGRGHHWRDSKESQQECGWRYPCQWNKHTHRHQVTIEVTFYVIGLLLLFSFSFTYTASSQDALPIQSHVHSSSSWLWNCAGSFANYSKWLKNFWSKETQVITLSRWFSASTPHGQTCSDNRLRCLWLYSSPSCQACSNSGKGKIPL